MRMMSAQELFQMRLLLQTAALAASLMNFVRGEKHTISFTNNCGFGTPTLLGSDSVLFRGNDSYTTNSSLDSALAYLDYGEHGPLAVPSRPALKELDACGADGSNCTMAELGLTNSDEGSIADVSLVPPFGFSVATCLSFYDGCDGLSFSCATSDCLGAWRKATDTTVTELICKGYNNVNLAIMFCNCDQFTSPARQSDGTTTTITISGTRTATNRPSPTAVSGESDSQSVSTSSPNIGAVAGGVVGGVLVLFALTVGVYLCLRRHRRKPYEPDVDEYKDLDPFPKGSPPQARMLFQEKGGDATSSSIMLGNIEACSEVLDISRPPPPSADLPRAQLPPTPTTSPSNRTRVIEDVVLRTLQGGGVEDQPSPVISVADTSTMPFPHTPIGESEDVSMIEGVVQRVLQGFLGGHDGDEPPPSYVR